MRSSFQLLGLLLAAICVLAACIRTEQRSSVQLVYIDRFDIQNKAEDLSEPSGLTLTPAGDALWTVSDNAKKIFQVTLQGKLNRAQSFDIADKGLEGITLDPTSAFLLTVKEEDNHLILIDVATHKLVQQKRLAELSGYTSVAADFAASDQNKGLEGVAWNSDSNTIFVLKEGEPGLLLELSADLSTILAHKRLNRQNGFVDNNVSDFELDFSGLFYDATRHNFWIVSDRGRRLFLYDWNANRVLESMALAYTLDGRPQEIEKAEGVAFDSTNSRLYVVSDAEARLYLFEVR
ncbi:MAG: SdiA-regulated domain-containing protein [Caldilineaceae bacterium]|nr:SdiA-regulated domain-containing protein [Caldilineaceae bacterium]